MRHRPVRRPQAGQPHSRAAYRGRTDLHAPHAPRRLVAFLALAAAGTAACNVSVSAGRNVDTAKAESTLRHTAEQLTGLPASRVDCPQRKIAKGDVFTCTAVVGSQTLRLKVTQVDDKGNVTVEPDQAVLDVAKATGEIADSIQRQTGVAVQVDCGRDAVLVRDVGATFDCQALGSDGRSRRVAVTVTDLTGQVHFELV